MLIGFVLGTQSYELVPTQSPIRGPRTSDFTSVALTTAVKPPFLMVCLSKLDKMEAGTTERRLASTECFPSPRMEHVPGVCSSLLYSMLLRARPPQATPGTRGKTPGVFHIREIISERNHCKCLRAGFGIASHGGGSG